MGVGWKGGRGRHPSLSLRPASSRLQASQGYTDIMFPYKESRRQDYVVHRHCQTLRVQGLWGFSQPSEGIRVYLRGNMMPLNLIRSCRPLSFSTHSSTSDFWLVIQVFQHPVPIVFATRAHFIKFLVCLPLSDPRWGRSEHKLASAFSDGIW